MSRRRMTTDMAFVQEAVKEMHGESKPIIAKPVLTEAAWKDGVSVLT